MNSATPAIQDLARRLIALEAPRDAGSSGGGSEAERACEKLRVPLAKSAGVAGYRSLISRAMAKAEAPSHELVQVRLAPGFREDFRESLYRMIGALTRTGVTIVSTVEMVESFTALALSPYAISFLSDDIIRMRYVEIGGQLRKVLMVVKMRGGNHSKDICEYDITSDGLQIGERLTGYRGLITGVPEAFGTGAGNTVGTPDERA